MKKDLDTLQRELSCCMTDKSTKTTIFVTLGAVGAVTLIGVAAAMVYNCKQMRAARTLKRTGKVLYMLGTAMRNVSGMEEI